MSFGDGAFLTSLNEPPDVFCYVGPTVSVLEEQEGLIVLWVASVHGGMCGLNDRNHLVGGYKDTVAGKRSRASSVVTASMILFSNDF